MDGTVTWSIRDFDQLDPKLYKAFMAAAETNNFTEAAVLVKMTQPGVSQHISKLEQQIGLPLFKRIGRQVTLTDAGKQLVAYIKKYLVMMEQFHESIQRSHQDVSGLVSYVMPASCLLSNHFTLMLEKRLAHDGIELDVQLGSTEYAIDAVLTDKADFAFVAGHIDSAQLEYMPFCMEEYLLVGSPEQVRSAGSRETVASLRFIHYPDFDTLARLWFGKAFGDESEYLNFLLHYSGRVNSLEAAIMMVRGGLGVSFFPRHCVEPYLETAEIIEVKLEEQLLHQVSIVKNAAVKLPKRVNMVIDWFLEMR